MHQAQFGVKPPPDLEASPPPDSLAPDGFLHHWIIGRFGRAVGEMFQLAGLAADCAADKVYECFFVAAPLNIQGGDGEPAQRSRDQIARGP